MSISKSEERTDETTDFLTQSGVSSRELAAFQSLNHRAQRYLAEGDAAKAEALYMQGVATAKHKFGTDHPLVAVTMSYLAALYVNEGRFAEAETFYKEAWTLLDGALGPDHPATAVVISNLSQLYLKQKRFSEADTLGRA